MPDHYRFGGGATESALSPVVLVAMLLAIVAILLLPRKFIVWPFLLIAFLVPSGEMLVVGGAHLFAVRIVILAGLGRLVAARFSGKNALGGGINSIDTVFLCWALSHSLAFMLLYGKADAVVNQLGFLWDSVGGYFFLRLAIHDNEDIARATKVFVWIAIIVAVCMANEQWSKTNVFGLIGGHPFPEIRGGKVRSQGPFSHAILAGVFGATIVPLFVRLWSTGKNKFLAVSGVIGATAMVIASASSTPFGAYVAGILGICLWPLRRYMRAIRWGIVLAILGLALIMRAPVWFLLAHVDLVGGSSGYHRAMLVDQSIRRFGDWWLLGARDNQRWGWDMWDIQNEFVAEALRGGLVALIFFVMIISRSFGRIGDAAWKLFDADGHQAWLIWILGVTLFAHVVAFLGVDYFDQTRFWWYASLAFVGAATAPVLSDNQEQTDELQEVPWDHEEIAQ